MLRAVSVSDGRTLLNPSEDPIPEALGDGMLREEDVLCLGLGTCGEDISTRAGCAPSLKDQQREISAFRVLLSWANVLFLCFLAHTSPFFPFDY